MMDTNQNCTMRLAASAAHELACQMEPLPQEFAHRLLLLHLGQTGCLDAEDFTQYFLALARRFRAFAHCLAEFQQDVSAEDREFLVLSNTPLYLQMHLARYINAAGDGLAQMEALIGSREQCAFVGAAGKRDLIAVSPGYFFQSVGLMSDPVWERLFAGAAQKASKVTNVLGGDGASSGLLAACVLFHHDDALDQDCLDDAPAVDKLYRECRQQVAAGNANLQLTGVDLLMQTLKSMSHMYSSHHAVADTLLPCSRVDLHGDAGDISLADATDMSAVYQLFTGDDVGSGGREAKEAIRGHLRRRTLWLMSLSLDTWRTTTTENLDRATEAVVATIDNLDTGEEQLAAILGRRDSSLGQYTSTGLRKVHNSRESRSYIEANLIFFALGDVANLGGQEGASHPPPRPFRHLIKCQFLQ